MPESENTCARVSFLVKLQVCNFVKKETLAQVFPCEFCEISKSTFSYRTPLVAASKSVLSVKQIGDKNVKSVCQSAKVLVNYTKFSIFLPTKS